jgi:hypothetical protein
LLAQIDRLTYNRFAIVGLGGLNQFAKQIDRPINNRKAIIDLGDENKN